MAHGTACLGPVTHAGCGALCPAYGRGCFGCFGPMESANPTALDAWLVAQGASSGELGRLYRSYNATAPAFSEAADRNERHARARKQRRTSGEPARERRR